MDKQTILIIGSGGREHAIAWKLKQSPNVGQIFIAPGNAGTATVGENVSLDITQNQEVVAFSKKNNIDLVGVIPEDFLAAGMIDALQKAGIRAFGPTKAATIIESSKEFAKKFMKEEGIPTAQFETFNDYKEAQKYLASHPLPVVIKASGLTLGKGVIIAHTRDEALHALEKIMLKKVYGSSGDSVVIEEYLEGQEISIHVFCDGKTAVLFPSSQDHKPIYDGDTGPNTGGMGTIAPVPWVTKKLMDEIRKTIVLPALVGLKKNGTPFTGILYPGIMVTKNGPKVLEFNARFGDPETQSYMRLLKTDLLDIFNSCIDGTLAQLKIEWSKEFACCIGIASRGYPMSSEKGIPILGIADAENEKDVVVFHAATKKNGDDIVTNGGRVLGISATGNTLNKSLKKAYNAVGEIQFPGMQYRTDIGRRKTII